MLQAVRDGGIVEFIYTGGLHSWMKQRVTKLESEKYFFAGNIAALSTIV